MSREEKKRDEFIAFIQCGGGESVKTIPLLIAKKMGYKVVVFDSNQKDIYGIADHYVCTNTVNIDTILTDFGEFYQRNKVVSVLTFTEFAVEQTAIIANVFGLQGLNVGAAKICRNKYLTRTLLAGKIPQGKFVCVRNIKDEMENIEKKLIFPIIIKPIMHAGSCAVMKVNNKTELRNKVEAIEEATDSAPMNQWCKGTLPALWICEEYIDGYEISVECITNVGETEVLAIHDKMLPVEAPEFLEQFFVTPSPRINKQFEGEIIELTKTILKLIKFDFGISHVEFRITEEGPQLLEINARIGGGLTGESVKYSTGIDMLETIIKLSVGDKVNYIPNKHIPTAIGVSFADAGKVREVIGIDKVNQMQGVKMVKQWFHPGDIVAAKQVGYGADVVVVSDESSQIAFEKVKEATNTIKFIVEDI